MIYLGGRVKTEAEGQIMAQQALHSGAGLEKLKNLIIRQGGKGEVIDHPELLPEASMKREIVAGSSGFVQAIDAKAVGLASQHTGAGRLTKEDAVDLSAGILLRKKVGDKVSRGECLAVVYGNNKNKLTSAQKEAEKAFSIGKEKVEKPQLIKNILGL